MSATLYKVLVAGRSCHGGDLAWSLPTQSGDGTWEPGAWHEHDGALSLCSAGLHLTSEPHRWYVRDDRCEVFAAEFDGESVSGGGDKQCVRRARLLRPVAWGSVGVHIVRDGEHAFSSGTIFASGSATVRASDSATVRASDSATVRAYDSVTVRASGSATVQAYGSATVRAYDSATVRAYDSATVRASDGATVQAYDSATVEASGGATVEAYDRATVTSTPYHTPGRSPDLGGEAVHVDRRGRVLVIRTACPAQLITEGGAA